MKLKTIKIRTINYLVWSAIQSVPTLQTRLFKVCKLEYRYKQSLAAINKDAGGKFEKPKHFDRLNDGVWLLNLSKPKTSSMTTICKTEKTLFPFKLEESLNKKLLCKPSVSLRNFAKNFKSVYPLTGSMTAFRQAQSPRWVAEPFEANFFSVLLYFNLFE